MMNVGATRGERAEHHPNVNPTFGVQCVRADTIPKPLRNLLIGHQVWFAASVHAAPNMFTSAVLPTLAAGGLKTCIRTPCIGSCWFELTPPYTWPDQALALPLANAQTCLENSHQMSCVCKKPIRILAPEVYI